MTRKRVARASVATGSSQQILPQLGGVVGDRTRRRPRAVLRCRDSPRRRRWRAHPGAAPSPCRRRCRRSSPYRPARRPASAIAASSIAGCGFEGWRSAVCRVTNRSPMPCIARQWARPRSDLPVATPSCQPAPCSAASSVGDASNSGSDSSPALARRGRPACRPRRRARGASGASSGREPAIASAGSARRCGAPGAVGRARPARRRPSLHRRADRRPGRRPACRRSRTRRGVHGANVRISCRDAGEPCGLEPVGDAGAFFARACSATA